MVSSIMHRKAVGGSGDVGVVSSHVWLVQQPQALMTCLFSIGAELERKRV